MEGASGNSDQSVGDHNEGKVGSKEKGERKSRRNETASPRFRRSTPRPRPKTIVELPVKFPLSEPAALPSIMNCLTDPSNVKQFTLIRRKAIAEWIVKRAVHPGEFYLEYKFDETIGEGGLAQTNYHKWWPRMQTFYNDPEKNAAYKLASHELILGRCLVLEVADPQDANNVTWQRVRVYEFVGLKRDERVKVFCLDNGNFESAHITQLRKLSTEFSNYECQLLRCHLVDVVPTAGCWTVDAIACFKELINDLEGSMICGIVLTLTRPPEEIQRGFPEYYQDLGVVIFGPKNCTLNASMVKEGHAIGTGLYSSCPHLLGRPKAWEGMNFDLEEFYKKHPNLRPKAAKPVIDVDLAQIRAITQAVISGRSYLGIPKQPDAREEQLLVEKGKKQQQELNWLPTALREKVGHVKIQHCLGPNFMILHTVKDSQSLVDMERAIGLTLSHARPLSEVQPMMFVVIRLVKQKQESVVDKDKTDNSDMCTWLRGMTLMPSDVKDIFKVIAVDYGKELFAHRKQIFALDKEFLEFPSLAIRVHLSVPNMVPAKESREWSERAKDYFFKYLLSWDNANPFYYAFRTGCEVIELDSLSQEIVLDKKTRKWVSAEGHRNNDYEPFALEIKNHPLIKPIFRSVGVQIKYEVRLNNSPVWYFRDLHDDLLDKKEAVMKMK